MSRLFIGLPPGNPAAQDSTLACPGGRESTALARAGAGVERYLHVHVSPFLADEIQKGPEAAGPSGEWDRMD